jgi:hypothetical protein
MLSDCFDHTIQLRARGLSRLEAALQANRDQPRRS